MKAVFLDRDGVLNKDKGHTFKVEDLELLDGVIEGLQAISRLGYKLIIITNQAGIAKGLFSLDDLHIFMTHLLQTLKNNNIEILDYFFCPHHALGSVKSFSIACQCRKPKPGMLFEAQSKHNIDLHKSIIIGDKESDILAGKNAGLFSNILIGNPSLSETSQASNIVDNLLQAFNVIEKY